MASKRDERYATLMRARRFFVKPVLRPICICGATETLSNRARKALRRGRWGRSGRGVRGSR